MRSSLKRWAILSMAAATWSGAMIAGGCGRAEADLSVRDAIVRSQAAQRKGGEEGQQEAQKILEEAVQKTDASPANKAQAKAALGQLQMEAARDTLRDAAHYEVEAARLGLQIAQLANQIGTSNALVQGYKQNDPQKVKDSIDQQIAAAQGGPDKPTWMTEGKMTIPTLASVTQTISKLQGEIAQKQDQLKTLDQQRIAALEDAEKITKASANAKGQEAVDAFKKAADLRKKAADLSVQIEQGNVALAPVKGDLAVAQGQQKIITDVIAQLKEQSQQLDAAWQNVQNLIGAQSKLATEIVGTASAGATTAPAESDDLAASGKSISEKAVALAAAEKQADDLREQAITDLSNASKQFEDAKSAATQLQQEIRTKSLDFSDKPQKKAWDVELAVVNPSTYQLAQAQAQRLLGDAHAARATSLNARLQLANFIAPILQNANVSVPEQLQSADLAKRLQEASNLADEAYKASDDALSNVIEGGAPVDVKTAAQIARIFVLYGHAQVAKLAGRPQDADQFMATAKQVITDLQSAGSPVTIPPLPGELASLVQPPASATTAPSATTGPATATAPSATPTATPAATGAAPTGATEPSATPAPQ